MFPFTSYEATKLLVDEHIAELRASAPRRRPSPRRRAGRTRRTDRVD
jgi:hypothetical protein